VPSTIIERNRKAPNKDKRTPNPHRGAKPEAAGGGRSNLLNPGREENLPKTQLIYPAPGGRLQKKGAPQKRKKEEKDSSHGGVTPEGRSLPKPTEGPYKRGGKPKRILLSPLKNGRNSHT